MTRRLKTAPGVIWTRITDSHAVAVSPCRASQEGCLLLTGDEAKLLARFSGREGASVEGLGPEERELIEKWLTPAFGLLEEVGEKGRAKDHEELALTVFMEYSSARELTGTHDLAKYHTKGIRDAFRQFEEVEMTVSHLFREPHPALGNMSYGGRFARVLLDEAALFKGARVIEVGCGTGIFGREFLGRVKESASGIYESLGYTFFDLSPVLAESQREINEVHRRIVSFESGDVLSHPFPEEGCDLLIANEMIADLPVVKLKRGAGPGDGGSREALDMAHRLGLDLSDAPPEFLINSGALSLLERLLSILRPGGRCYIVEYGSSWAYPSAQRLTDHVEYSIHFGHLETAAGALGLNPELLELAEFLGFEGEIKVLGNMGHRALFGHLLPFLGMEPTGSRVYTRQMLDRELAGAAARVENLEFVPLGELGGIAFPRGFYVLKLAKGATSTRRKA